MLEDMLCQVYFKLKLAKTAHLLTCYLASLLEEIIIGCKNREEEK
jgi:hypothetical protein